VRPVQKENPILTLIEKENIAPNNLDPQQFEPKRKYQCNQARQGKAKRRNDKLTHLRTNQKCLPARSNNRIFKKFKKKS
jgi:hypothetical protein